MKSNSQQQRNRRKSSRPRKAKNNSKDYSVVPTLGLGRSIPIGFPDKIMGRVRYHSSGPLTVGGGAIAKYVFRWNSTFDPDYTGVGHQPLFRDTFAAIYDQYAVVRATAKITFINSSNLPFYVGHVTDDDPTTSTLLDTLCEQTHCVHKVIPALTGSLSSCVMNASWDCKKILQIDPYTSELYKTAVGSNPTEESTLTLWALSSDASAASVFFDIELTYEVLWTELTTPVQS